MTSARPSKSLCLDYLLSPENGVEERLAMVVVGNDAVADFLRRNCRLGDGDVFAFLIAYEELVTNVARHAVRPGKDPVRLFARLECTGPAVSLTVGDDGPQFNPVTGELKTPGIDGGQGLNLIRGYFPQARYVRQDGCNIVRVEKDCSVVNTETP